ncbi:MAG: hypothetical protein AAF657_10490, partial [Acidobacteriota bacterium]
GLEIHPGSDSATFDGWYEAEGEWRWARSATPSLRFRLERAPARDYILAFSGGSAAPVEVEFELNGVIVGRGHFDDLVPRDHRFLIDAAVLAMDGTNELRLRASGEPVVPAGESRALGLGLRTVRLTPLRFPSAALHFTDDDYFLSGFSIAEKRLRWTREPAARLVYPLHTLVHETCYQLHLSAAAFEHQQVDLRLNGQSVAQWTFEGLEPQIRSIRIASDLLREGPNLLEFDLPGARRPEGDPRRLALAFISVRMYPLRDCS